MERLTYRLTDGQAVIDCEKCKEGRLAEASWHTELMERCSVLYCRNRLKERVAAYEDTGLTPEEIDQIRYEHWAATPLITGYSIPRLQELAEADKEEGRIIITSDSDSSPIVGPCYSCEDGWGKVLSNGVYDTCFKHCDKYAKYKIERDGGKPDEQI